MAYAYRNNNNKAKQTSSPKIIYAEDELCVRENATGWCIFHTTLDPAAQYKQKTVGNVSDKPEKIYIVKKIRYGPNMDKIKYLLDKEKLKDILDDQFDYVVSSDPSPWLPKKLGGAKRQKPDSDTEEDTPTTTSQPPPLSNSELSKKIDDCYLLLTELINHKRQENTVATE
jgi:hypothetical protein